MYSLVPFQSKSAFLYTEFSDHTNLDAPSAVVDIHSRFQVFQSNTAIGEFGVCIDVYFNTTINDFDQSHFISSIHKN
jgi:hypothetical protein